MTGESFFRPKYNKNKAGSRFYSRAAGFLCRNNFEDAVKISKRPRRCVPHTDFG